ncbi:MAG TPA: hypothetical protein VFV98_06420 [Vicinamibacterales bacterium]|nr:hypothetical protein [Vicinamibacterales bacterium]
MRLRTVCIFLLSLMLPAVAGAQGTRWGVQASFTPTWTGNESFTKWINDGSATLEGSEWSIGFARGTMSGGDWGVSYVRKPFKDGSTFVEHEEDCFSGSGGSGCFVTDETTTTRGVYLRGVEVTFFIPVYSKSRFQIGINAGGGAGFVEGNVDVVSTFSGGGQPTNTQTYTDEASEVFWPVTPLIKAEAQVAIAVAPGLKIKVGGGLNTPGYAFRMGAVYLFGAK